jgi:hypothetical protein
MCQANCVMKPRSAHYSCHSYSTQGTNVQGPLRRHSRLRTEAVDRIHLAVLGQLGHVVAEVVC